MMWPASSSSVLFVLVSLSHHKKLCNGWSSLAFLGYQSRRSTCIISTSTTLKSKNDYNVVFRPSSDPDSFDSFKIGTARVHRYSDPNSMTDDTEYIMWYHARDSGFDSDNSLPPLSTGRIGRATSRNGLVWERDETGSYDSDKEGVSLGLNTDSWWGFDTAHIGLGQVLMPMVSPSIRSEGGVYVMYYCGGSHEETNIIEYLDAEKSSQVPNDATIKGMKLKIGAAISQDGVTWGRIEGDDPSGACMVPFDASNDDSLDFGRDHPEELYTGWPEVIVNPVAASESTRNAATDNNRENFFMYYSTMLADTKEKAIGVASSSNGFAFEKKGIALTPTPGTLDAGGCARCNVIPKGSLNEEGFWEEEENSWIMFYEGVSLDGKHRILAAESSDLKTWKKTGLALDVGEGEEAWDCDGVGSPHVIRLDDGFFRMYYNGVASNGETAIGVAKSFDLMNWTREQAALSFSLQ